MPCPKVIPAPFRASATASVPRRCQNRNTGSPPRGDARRSSQEEPCIPRPPAQLCPGGPGAGPAPVHPRTPIRPPDGTACCRLAHWPGKDDCGHPCGPSHRRPAKPAGRPDLAALRTAPAGRKPVRRTRPRRLRHLKTGRHHPPRNDPHRLDPALFGAGVAAGAGWWTTSRTRRVTACPGRGRMILFNSRTLARPLYPAPRAPGHLATPDAWADMIRPDRAAYARKDTALHGE